MCLCVWGGGLTWKKKLFLKKVHTTLLVTFAACFRAVGIWTVTVDSAETPCVC